MSYASETNDKLRGKTIIDADVNGGGIRLTLSDGLVLDIFDAIGAMAKIIDQSPTVERPHGEWIEKTGMRPPEDKGVKFCSNCMNRQPREFITHKPIEPDFCPKCGADMREGEAE